jgi:predicted alpha/beta hydrolase family esterase
MTFIPNSGGGVESVRILDAASVGLILVSGAGIDRPTIWESNFDCNADDQATSADPLSFIETVSPSDQFATPATRAQRCFGSKRVDESASKLRFHCASSGDIGSIWVG